MLKLSRIILVLLAVAASFLFVVFFLANLDPIKLDFIYYETVEMPKALLLLIAFLFGIALGIAGMLSVVWTQHRKIRSIEKELSLVNAELKAFRMRPLEHQPEEDYKSPVVTQSTPKEEQLSEDKQNEQGE